MLFMVLWKMPRVRARQFFSSGLGFGLETQKPGLGLEYLLVLGLGLESHASGLGLGLGLETCGLRTRLGLEETRTRCISDYWGPQIAGTLPSDCWSPSDCWAHQIDGAPQFSESSSADCWCPSDCWEPIRLLGAPCALHNLLNPLLRHWSGLIRAENEYFDNRPSSICDITPVGLDLPPDQST